MSNPLQQIDIQRGHFSWRAMSSPVLTTLLLLLTVAGCSEEKADTFVESSPAQTATLPDFSSEEFQQLAEEATTHASSETVAAGPFTIEFVTASLGNQSVIEYYEPEIKYYGAFIVNISLAADSAGVIDNPVVKYDVIDSDGNRVVKLRSLSVLIIEPTPLRPAGGAAYTLTTEALSKQSDSFIIRIELADASNESFPIAFHIKADEITNLK